MTALYREDTWPCAASQAWRNLRDEACLNFVVMKFLSGILGSTAPKGPPRDWPTCIRARGKFLGQPGDESTFGKMASGPRPEATWL